jgi:crotonobetainyl-CoA:carnitine CoA-transferase CaiB-like acyl-CoA transferase
LEVTAQVATADAVVENFRSGVTRRFGLEFEASTLQRFSPKSATRRVRLQPWSIL